eukprot:3586408-Rhodomonas_salina.1
MRSGILFRGQVQRGGEARARQPCLPRGRSVGLFSRCAPIYACCAPIYGGAAAVFAGCAPLRGSTAILFAGCTR